MTFPHLRPPARRLTTGRPLSHHRRSIGRGGMNDDLNLVRGRQPVRLGLVVCGTDGAHFELVLLVLAPVQPHLEAKDEVEYEGEGEARADDGVPHLSSGRE